MGAKNRKKITWDPVSQLFDRHHDCQPFSWHRSPFHHHPAHFLLWRMVTGINPNAISKRSTHNHTSVTDGVSRKPLEVLCLLQRSETPSETELKSLNAYAEQCKSETARLDLEIHHLMSNINDLQRKLGKAKEKRQEYERCQVEIAKLQAPVRRLPAEVLSQIFLWHKDVSEGDNSGGLGKIKSRYCPLMLGRVCRSWKSAALRTPRLWNCLHLSVSWDTIEDGTAVATFGPLAREWYRRAGSIPLSLSLDLTRCGAISLPRKGADASVKRFTQEIIAPYMGRMRHFSVSGCHVLLLLISLQPWKFQKLESVTLWCSDYGSRPERFDSPDVLSAFRESSNLHRFCLTTTPRLLRVANYVLPWNQLTHLILPEPNNPTHFLNILKQCSKRLEHAFLGLDETNIYSFSEVRPPIILSRLLELTIVFVGPVDPTAFRHLHFPLLRTLRVASEQTFEEEEFWVQSSEFYAKLAGIHRLSLAKHWRIPSRELHSLLRATPSLVELDLDVQVSYRDLHGFFDSVPSALQALYITFTSSTELAECNITDTFIMSTGWVSSLKTLRFFLDDGHGEYIEPFEQEDVIRLKDTFNEIKSATGGNIGIDVIEPGNTPHWLSRLQFDSGNWAEGMRFTSAVL